MNSIKNTVISVVSGAVITAITGEFNSTPGQLIGASWYGYPLSWLTKRVLAPQYNPWFINYTNLVGDVLIWSGIVCVILILIKYGCDEKLCIKIFF
jgi:hypothetical protein